MSLTHPITRFQRRILKAIREPHRWRIGIDKATIALLVAHLEGGRYNTDQVSGAVTFLAHEGWIVINPFGKLIITERGLTVYKETRDISNTPLGGI